MITTQVMLSEYIYLYIYKYLSCEKEFINSTWKMPSMCHIDRQQFAIFPLKSLCPDCAAFRISGRKTEPNDFHRPFLRLTLDNSENFVGKQLEK